MEVFKENFFPRFLQVFILVQCSNLVVRPSQYLLILNWSFILIFMFKSQYWRLCILRVYCFGSHNSEVSVVFQCSQHAVHLGQNWVFKPCHRLMMNGWKWMYGHNCDLQFLFPSYVGLPDCLVCSGGCRGCWGGWCVKQCFTLEALLWSPNPYPFKYHFWQKQ